MSAATRVRQVSTEVMHAIGQVFTRMYACSIYFLMCVHMPFGREPMTWMIIWEPSHGWSVVSDLIYFVDLRSALPRPRRPVSLICVRRRRLRRGVADGSRQLSLGPAERSFCAVCALPRCLAKLLLESVVAAERRRRPADLPPR